MHEIVRDNEADSLVWEGVTGLGSNASRVNDTIKKKLSLRGTHAVAETRADSILHARSAIRGKCESTG